MTETPVNNQTVRLLTKPEEETNKAGEADRPAIREKPAERRDHFQPRRPILPDAQRLGKKIQLTREAKSGRRIQLPPVQRIRQAYKTLSQDPLMKQLNMRQSGVVRHIQERFTGTSDRSNVNKSVLAQLVHSRNQFKDKPRAREAIRYEIIRLRSTQSEHRHKVEKFAFADHKESAKSFLKKQSVIVGQLENKALEGESGFEQGLKKSLQGITLVKNVPAGEKAVFTAKSEGDWKTFFKNVLSRGSVEKSVMRQSSSVLAALFRGTLKPLVSEKGVLLVSDISHQPETGRVLADKFARVLVENPQLQQTILSLKPGEPIPPQFFLQLGQEFELIRLQHQVNGGAEISDEMRQQSLAQLKNPANLEAQGRLEQALAMERIRWFDVEKEKLLEEKRGSARKSQIFPWAWSEPDWLKKKERHPGRFRPWVFFGYCVATVLSVIIGYLVFRMV